MVYYLTQIIDKIERVCNSNKNNVRVDKRSLKMDDLTMDVDSPESVVANLLVPEGNFQYLPKLAIIVQIFNVLLQN